MTLRASPDFGCNDPARSFSPPDRRVARHAARSPVSGERTMQGMLIRNGTVVDGTGAPAYPADVRIADGTITEIGQNLAAYGEREFDAAGCHVTPGFIESHTHYDGTMWWQNDLDPLPGYGATTMILGNCGFSPAPLHKYMPAQREMIGIFSFFEDIPEGPFMANLPWDWNKWSEYRASVERNVKVPLNYAAYT